MTRRTSPPPRGFTLVELLTVIAIISLLIGMLLPSLSKARAQAKKVKVQSQLDSIGKGLEMFRNEHKDQYPDSAATRMQGATYVNRTDPLSNDPGVNAGYTGQLNGAHWLARALVGYDLRGIDAAFEHLDGCRPDSAAFGNCDVSRAAPGVERHSAFIQLEAAKIVRDNDFATHQLQQIGMPDTGRFVLMDAYGFPILYYRATPGGEGIGDTRANWELTLKLRPAAYYHEDNRLFAGCGKCNTDGWLFKGRRHLIAEYCDGYPADPSKSDKPETFVNYFHNHDVHTASGVVTPYNADTFILLSAGEDGAYGNRDDVRNFKIGG